MKKTLINGLSYLSDCMLLGTMSAMCAVGSVTFFKKLYERVERG